MRQAKALAVLALVAVAGGLWVYSGGCDRPKPHEPVEAKEYLFWFVDGVDQSIYGYSPTRGVVDSFQLAVTGTGLWSLSADGSTMYVPTERGIVAVDLATKWFRLFWPNEGTVTASPDGRYLAIMDGDLHILNSDDLSIVFHDTTAVGHGQFSRNGRTFYGIAPDSGRHVYRVTLDESFQVYCRWFGNYDPAMVCTSGDDRKWFLMHWAQSCNGLFRVYDVEGDSTVFAEWMQPGSGHLVASPDGRYVYYSNPGPIGGYPCTSPAGDSMITIFDVEANAVATRLSTTGRYGDMQEVDSLVLIYSMAISPDGKWLLGTSLFFNRFVLVDTEARVIARYEAWGSGLDSHWFRMPIAQPGL
jgi:hypothetical protein